MVLFDEGTVLLWLAPVASDALALDVAGSALDVAGSALGFAGSAALDVAGSATLDVVAAAALVTNDDVDGDLVLVLRAVELVRKPLVVAICSVVMTTGRHLCRMANEVAMALIPGRASSLMVIIRQGYGV